MRLSGISKQFQKDYSRKLSPWRCRCLRSRRSWSQLPSGDERVVAVGRCERNLLKAGFAKQLLELTAGELLALGKEDHVHRERGRCKRGVPRVLKEHLVQVDPPSGRKTLEALPGEETTAFPTPVMKDVAQEVGVVTRGPGIAEHVQRRRVDAILEPVVGHVLLC